MIDNIAMKGMEMYRDTRQVNCAVSSPERNLRTGRGEARDGEEVPSHHPRNVNTCMMRRTFRPWDAVPDSDHTKNYRRSGEVGEQRD